MRRRSGQRRRLLVVAVLGRESRRARCTIRRTTSREPEAIMLRVGFLKVRPDQVDRLRAWTQELTQRRDEVLETFRAESTRHECAYLLQGASGLILVYVQQVDDPERARRAFAASQLPIDLEHKQVMAEVREGPAEAELLFDISAERA
jgi:Family of unknown function (DUF6176)